MASRRVTRILAAVVAGAAGGEALPEVLVRACVRSLPVTGAGMALMSPAGPAGTVTATDAAAQQLEELQFTLGEGPCIDASRTGRPVLQPDLARTAPQRWPAFADGAARAGLRAVFAFPLRVGGIQLGVLDLHRDVPGVLSSREFADALAFADAATVLLLHAQALQAGARLPPDLTAAVEDRAEVHQATGVVSVQAGVGLAVALVMLRARAYADHRPIAELARDVLRGRVHLGQDDGA
ncbi:GAF and ANTAR domain-containing protein [Geodermatophilus sabuli]|uniref:ANTAR domain-containing protein n=1 Tax=Geodermatophilus sabuli TaxID=1564158 RepID=A0A285EHE2_9ACTN|nr:GAF and ANTAR domain-containing protein [Geodermatophilus sabuli]MBB3083903.1 GAF domain-containing protein [Geodermatophilus sabuli]SNX98552.1 ANTAR domain-containing protein [Geodermatophilus sabuli]